MKKKKKQLTTEEQLALEKLRLEKERAEFELEKKLFSEEKKEQTSLASFSEQEVFQKVFDFYEKGMSPVEIAETFNLSIDVVQRWVTAFNAYSQLNTLIEIPKDLQLPTYQEVVLQNLNIIEKMLGSLLPLVDKLSSDSQKIRFGFKEKGVKVDSMGNVIEYEYPYEIKSTRYGFAKGMDGLYTVLLKILKQRADFVKELPDLAKQTSLEEKITEIGKLYFKGELDGFQRSELPPEGIVYDERSVEDEIELKKMEKHIVDNVHDSEDGEEGQLFVI